MPKREHRFVELAQQPATADARRALTERCTAEVAALEQDWLARLAALPPGRRSAYQRYWRRLSARDGVPLTA